MRKQPCFNGSRAIVFYHSPGMAERSSSRQFGRSNFLEVSDCFDRPPSRQRPSSISSTHSLATGFVANNVRRSSSLQFPTPRREVLLPPPTFLQSAISHIKYSSASIYASTLSAAGLLNGVGLGGLRSPGSIDSTEAVNLWASLKAFPFIPCRYSIMASYHCCCGLIRLRLASLLVGLATCMVTTFLLCCLLLHAPFPPTVLLSDWQCRAICQPTILLLTFASLASLLMLLALITDIHFLLLPFMLSCLLNIMGSLALGLVLLLNPTFPLATKSKLEQLMPAGLALISTCLIALFLWLLTLTSFTFVLIRDKRTIFREMYIAELGDDEDELLYETNPLLLRRSSSAPLDRLNSAEF